MTTLDLSSFRQVLSKKQKELARSSQALDSIAVERSADAIEEATYKSARELAVTSLNREAMLRRSVAMALVRIQDGTFGACAHCGDEIAKRRLEAVPWTPIGNIELNENMEFGSPPSTRPYRAQRTSQ